MPASASRESHLSSQVTSSLAKLITLSCSSRSVVPAWFQSTSVSTCSRQASCWTKRSTRIWAAGCLFLSHSTICQPYRWSNPEMAESQVKWPCLSTLKSRTKSTLKTKETPDIIGLIKRSPRTISKWLMSDKSHMTRSWQLFTTRVVVSRLTIGRK